MTTAIFRRRLAEISSQLLVAFVAVALLSSPFLKPLDLLMLQLGVGTLIFTLVVWFLIHQKIVTTYSPHLLIVASYICIMPLILLSGGVNSHFAYLVPVAPLMAGLLLGFRAAYLVAALMILSVALLQLNADALPVLASAAPTPGSEHSLLRAYWISLTILITTIFVHCYDQFNTVLRGQLRDLAFNDPLTRIPNRRSIVEALRLARDIARYNNDWLSVIMVDLDFFKELNDAYGHAAGDRCLIAVADCLKRSVRSQDDMVGRIGGEEFVVVLPMVSRPQLQRIAEQIRQNIESLEVGLEDGQSVTLTATLGCCCGQGMKGISVNRLLEVADAALYAGKSSGRNRVVIDEPDHLLQGLRDFSLINHP